MAKLSTTTTFIWFHKTLAFIRLFILKDWTIVKSFPNHQIRHKPTQVVCVLNKTVYSEQTGQLNVKTRSVQICVLPTLCFVVQRLTHLDCLEMRSCEDSLPKSTLETGLTVQLWFIQRNQKSLSLPWQSDNRSTGGFCPYNFQLRTWFVWFANLPSDRFG